MLDTLATDKMTGPTLQEALRALAGVCDGATTLDGQGFNKRDAGIGRSLAKLTRLTPKQAEVAYKILHTYRGQLLGLGIAYEDITPPSFRAAASGEPLPDAATSLVVQVLGPGGVIASQLPGYESRPEQLRVATRIEQALCAHEHATIEAGTGVGKSLAYLVPAILSGRQTIVSTADKALQAQIVNKDIPFLQRVLPAPFTAVLMKGRANYLCRYKFSDVQEQERRLARVGGTYWDSAEAEQAWPSFKAWTEETDDGDLDTYPIQLPLETRTAVTATSHDCLGRHCPDYGSCYAEIRKAAARTADVIIANHALLLRDMVVKDSSAGHASVLPTAKVIVVDEAHQLPEIAIGAFGTEITYGRFIRLAKLFSRLTVEHPDVKGPSALEEDRVRASELWDHIKDVYREAERVFLYILAPRFDEKITTILLGDEPEVLALGEAIAQLASYLDDRCPPWIEDGPPRLMWGKVAGQIYSLADDLRLVGSPRAENFVRYAEIHRERVTLFLKPIDVAPYLERLLWRQALDDDGIPTRTVIATSATLKTTGGFGYWKTQVGLEDGSELAIGSPFDYPRHALLYLPEDGALFDSSRYRLQGQDGYLDRLADTYAALLLASRGRAFCLFTSYRTLEAIHSRLWDRFPDHLVLKQGEAPRPELVRQFKEHGSAILFGVKSFWEGIDVVGEALSLVAIDKLPFIPPGDPVWDAQCAAANKRTGSEWGWFNELAVPAATIALKQGFGRLIRSKSDRGVIALLDGRLQTKKYGKQMLAALPPATKTSSLEDVRAFFDN